VPTQTDVQQDGHEVEFSAQNTDRSQGKAQYEEDIKMLQHKLRAQMKAYDESRVRLCQELSDMKKYLDDSTSDNEKLKTERDLALQEVNELRKLLSISRNALACINETPERQMSYQESWFKTNYEVGSSDNKNLGQPVPTYVSTFKPQVKPKSHPQLVLNYDYSSNANPYESIIALRKSETLVKEKYPDAIYVSEQSSADPIQASSSNHDLEEPTKGLTETIESERDIAVAAVAASSSPSSDNYLDTTYGSCEFDEESEL